MFGLFSKLLLVATVSLFAELGHAKPITVAKSDADRIFYEDYQRYRLSQANDYSSVLDKQLVIELASSDPKLTKEQLTQKLNESRAARNSLFKTFSDGYHIPKTAEALGDFVISAATGFIPDNTIGKVGAPAAKLIFTLAKNAYEDYRTPRAKYEAGEALVTAHEQGEDLIRRVNTNARAVRKKNKAAAEVIDAIDRMSVGVTMSSTKSDILGRDSAYKTTVEVRNLSVLLGPDGPIQVDLGQLQDQGKQSLSGIQNLVQRIDAQEKSAAEKRARQETLEGLRSGLFITTQLLALSPDTQKASAHINAVGSAALQIVAAVDKFKDGGKLASLVLTGDMVSVGFALVSAFSKSGPTADQIIIERLGDLRRDIGQMSTQLNSRFDNVDLQLRNIWSTLNLGLSKLQRSAALAAQDLAIIRARLDTLTNRLGRVEANILSAISAVVKSELVQRVDSLVLTTPPPKYQAFQEAAIYIGGFATTTANESPFVINRSLSDVSVDELLSNLTGQSESSIASGIGFDSSSLRQIGPSINLVDQIARSSVDQRATPLPNPGAWIFGAQQFARLLVARPAADRTRLSKAIVDRIMEPGRRLLAAHNQSFGVRGTAGAKDAGQKTVLRVFREYETALSRLTTTIARTRLEYSEANVAGVPFWMPLDAMLLQDAKRTKSIPTTVSYCDADLPGDLLAGRFVKMNLAMPPNYGKFVDPIYFLAQHMSLLDISYCQYSSELPNEELDFTAYRSGGGSTLTIASRKRRVSGSIDDTIASFSDNSIEEDFSLHALAGAQPGAFDWQRWIAYCYPLLERPTGALGNSCEEWRKARFGVLVAGSALWNWTSSFGTSKYERAEDVQAVRQQVLRHIDSERNKFAKILDEKLQREFLQNLRELSLAKQKLIAVLSWAYSRQLAHSDKLRAMLFGSNQIFDEISLMQFLNGDSENGLRAVTVDDEAQRRVRMARSALRSLPENDGLPAVERMIAVLESLL